MPILEQLKTLLKPWWNKSRRNRLEALSFALTHVSLQLAVFIATTPQNTSSAEQLLVELNNSSCTPDNDFKSSWQAYAPIVVPMCASAINRVVFLLLHYKIADALQQDMTTRILMGNNNDAKNLDCKNVGLMQIFAQKPLSATDIENLGSYIDDASKASTLFGELMNVVPMLLYGRMAYLNLPEARNTLYLGAMATTAGCFLQRFLFLQLKNSDKIINEQDKIIKTRIGRDIRQYDAIIAGQYQNVEHTTLRTYIDEKNAAYLRLMASFSSAFIVNGFLELGLSVLTQIVVGQQYPHLKGSQGLINFGLAMNLFAGSLLHIIYAFGDKYAKTSLALEKVAALDKLLTELEELAKEPFLNLNYTAVPTVSKNVIEFKDLLLAIPSEESKDNSLLASNIKEKIAAITHANNANFVDLPQNFSLSFGALYRICGESGIGKSRLFATILGFWPYASGSIMFNCRREEIYVMPQEQLFVKGTLLENIYYPQAVPQCFIESSQDSKVKYDLSSTEAQLLCQTMRQIGLDKEILRLSEFKDWGEVQDLSPGMKKRISFLRLYIRAMSKGNLYPPKVIMIDEANSGVDGQNGLFMEGLIRKLRRQFPQACVLFIKHDLGYNEKSFNEAQRELVQEDPQIYTGLENCQALTLKRTTKDKLAKSVLGNSKSLLISFNQKKNAILNQSNAQKNHGNTLLVRPRASSI